MQTNYPPAYVLIEVFSPDMGSILYRSITTINSIENEVFNNDKGWPSGIGYLELEQNCFHVSLYETRDAAVENFSEPKRLKYEERELMFVIRDLEEARSRLAVSLREDANMMDSDIQTLHKEIDRLNSILPKFSRQTISIENLVSISETPNSSAAFRDDLAATLEDLSKLPSSCSSCKTENLFHASVKFHEMAVQEPFLSATRYFLEARSFMDDIDREESAQVNKWNIDQAVHELSRSVACINLLKSISSFRESALGLVDKVLSEVHSRRASGIEKFDVISPICYWVYLTYSSSGDLLYIGKTSSLYHRFTAHAQGSVWFSEMDSMAAIPFSTDAEALHKEYLLIRELHPIYNIVHNSNRDK